MESVPPELWQRILSFLPPPLLLRCATLTLKFNQITLPLLHRFPHLYSSAQLDLFLQHLHTLVAEDSPFLANIKEIRISLANLEDVTAPLLGAIHLLEDSGVPPLQFLSLSAVRGLDLTMLPSALHNRNPATENEDDSLTRRVAATIQSIDIDSNLYPLSQLDSLPAPDLSHIKRLTLRSHYLVAVQACLRDWYATLLRSFTGLVGLKVVGLELRRYLNHPTPDEITTWLTNQNIETATTTLDTIQNLAWYTSDVVLFQAFLSTLPNLKTLQTTTFDPNSLLHIISPSFHTLKIFRTSNQPPRPVGVLETEINRLVVSLDRLEQQGRCQPKRLCIDYEWWPLRKSLKDTTERMGMEVVWGVFATDMQEEWLPEWGERIPDNLYSERVEEDEM